MEYVVWPNGQSIRRWAGTDIMVSQFDDQGDFGSALRSTVTERSENRDLSHHFEASDRTNAVKVYDIHKWNTPEANIINARALVMFGKIFKMSEALVDASWASVYSAGNFVLPHSHVGSVASVLYMLDPGDNAENTGGQFLFADPRLKPCCRQQTGYMTTPSAPEIQPGTMVMFPGKTIHLVTPYLGKNPRITLSWDLKLDAASKSAVPEFMTRPI